MFPVTEPTARRPPESSHTPHNHLLNTSSLVTLTSEVEADRLHILLPRAPHCVENYSHFLENAAAQAAVTKFLASAKDSLVC